MLTTKFEELTVQDLYTEAILNLKLTPHTTIIHLEADLLKSCN